MKAITYLLASLIWGAVSHADMPSTHGMVVFGNKTIYASHLPMFHKPHDYQVILKVDFKNIESSQVVEAYEAQKDGGNQQFTLKPGMMDLTEVIDGKITSFPAQLFKGHFEKGGVNLGPVTVQIEKIVMSKKLDPQESKNGEYLVFGESGEYFAAHLIKGLPSFDAILKVKQISHSGHPGQYCRTRWCPQPTETPVSDDLLPMTFHTFLLDEDQMKVPAPGSYLGSLSYSTQVLKSIYVEKDELAH